jgi:hypothetical protein
VSGSQGALLFSQCNVVCRSFVQARSSAKYGSSVSARFLIYGIYAVFFCTLVAILDPLSILSLLMSFLILKLRFCVGVDVAQC